MDDYDALSTADDLAIRIVETCIDEDKPTGKLTAVLDQLIRNPAAIEAVLIELGLLVADLALDAAAGDKDAAKRDIEARFV